MSEYKLNSSEIRQYAGTLRAGDRVFLSGTVYTARDAAHKRLCEMLDNGDKLPIELDGAIIYYAGPTPGVGGRAVGACGPTTSSRMDAFAPRLLRLGLAAMIGKGERNDEVVSAIKETKSVYFCFVGGAGALASKHISAAEEIAFPELGCESIKKLTVSDMPLTVAVDAFGGNIFDERKKYKR